MEPYTEVILFVNHKMVNCIIKKILKILCKTKIRHNSLPIFQKNISRLDIPMHNLIFLKIHQTIKDILNIIKNLNLIDRSTLFNKFFKISIKEISKYIIPILIPIHISATYNIFMVDTSKNLNLGFSQMFYFLHSQSIYI